MFKANIFNHGWIDLVFEGRNQSYGAYQLRREDNKTTLLALITGIALMAVLISIPVINNRYLQAEAVTEEPPIIDRVIEVNQDIFSTPKKPEPPKPEPQTEQVQAPAAAAPSTTPTVQLTDLNPVTDPETEVTTTMDDFIDAEPGQVTDPGTGPDGIDLGAPTGTTPGGTGTAATGAPDGIETRNSVDVMPQYPGGMEKFYKEVVRKFSVPAASTNTLRVIVSFIVEKDGTMTNIKVTRDPGYGMADEAIRVLKSIKTKWHPGLKNGKEVRTAYSLPITIQIN